MLMELRREGNRSRGAPKPPPIGETGFLCCMEQLLQPSRKRSAFSCMRAPLL